MATDIIKTIRGNKISVRPYERVAELAKICRSISAEGTVLLKNDNNLLPFFEDATISVFGRAQANYYSAGTGSGGSVSPPYITNIVNALRESGKVTINEDLVEIYKEFVQENPYENGKDWTSIPLSQKEMPLTDQIVNQAKEKSDIAVIIIGRTSGEENDNYANQGSYILSDVEENMIAKVSAVFNKVCVVLNVSNIIDLSFLDRYKIDSLIYVWQGGMEGGNAVADILTGKVSPSGKLTDTIAYSIDDYPSTNYFSGEYEVDYVEDIYVGYRYFETFAKDKVRYPFGFGLSYTNFEIEVLSVVDKGGKIVCKVEVTNKGSYPGKEVVQVYHSAPQGNLGKPTRQLIAFSKTKLLNPTESERLTLSFDIDDMSSYDDSGKTGNKSCYVLEAGDYGIYIGNNVRDAKKVFTYTVDQDMVCRQLTPALVPTKPFKRIIPISNADGTFSVGYEDVPLRDYNVLEKIEKSRPEEIAYSGDKGYKLIDVANKKCTLDQFVAQLSDLDMACIIMGEGFNSPKVTPGNASAFGGVSESLLDFGIPVLCTCDGPSGIRVQPTFKVTALPIGTLLASTWNLDAVQELFEYESVELFAFNVDALLAPGINIHRNPLNGRNFEYFSEDPFLTGKLAVAVCQGLSVSKVSGTIKHLFANNREKNRSELNSVLSERASREIYLRAFEMAVKESSVKAIMTSYNLTNGIYTSSDFELNTQILREEWGYTGFVMTDWWARVQNLGQKGDLESYRALVRSQNDVYMVCDGAVNSTKDVIKALNEGYITRGELQRNAKNILNFVLQSVTFEKFVKNGCKRPVFKKTDNPNLQTLFVVDNPKSEERFSIQANRTYFFVKVSGKSLAPSLVQKMAIVYLDGEPKFLVDVTGQKEKTEVYTMCLENGTHDIYIKFDKDTIISQIEVEKVDF